jgi:multidrug transporter EmrE-like cation transporter
LIYLFLHVAAANTFALITRYAHGVTMTYFTVGAVNYATAMVVAVTWAMVDGGLVFEWPAVVFGLVQGLVYQSMYIVLFWMITLGGLSVSFTINRLAIAIPIAGGILLWGEAPSAFRFAGIMASFVALPLIGSDAQRVARRTGASSRLMPLLTLYSIVSLGISGLAARAFVETAVEAEAIDLSAFTFIAATASSVVTWPLVGRLARGQARRQGYPAPRASRRAQTRAVVVGMLLGLLNLAQSFTMVIALFDLPASFVFPFISTAALLILTAVDYLVWKQRFGRLTLIGMVLSAFTIVAINL